MPLVMACAGGVAFFVLIALRVFVFEMFRNPSGSMLPTLAVGDHFVVNKLAGAPAQRGDVIVFKFPEHPEQDFVKRVVATGGDVLDVTNGVYTRRPHRASREAEAGFRNAWSGLLQDAD